MSKLDKYYTNISAVKYCMKLFNRHIKVKKNDLIIEPSAGNGAFIKEIEKIKANHIYYDIKPEDKRIIRKDFLKLTKIAKKGKIHVVGNPPFGYKSSLAIKFIKKAAKIAETIAFILPKSFKKNSNQKAFPLNFHLILQKDLPKDSFIWNNESYDVPCVFQIWKKKEYDRKVIKKPYINDFKFVKKDMHPDIAIRRVGSKAGSISFESETKNSSSFYFIKIIAKDKSEVIKKLQNITYKFNNTVGAKSISKYELLIAYSKK